MFPLAFWVPIFDPQPHQSLVHSLSTNPIPEGMERTKQFVGITSPYAPASKWEPALTTAYAPLVLLRVRGNRFVHVVFVFMLFVLALCSKPAGGVWCFKSCVVVVPCFLACLFVWRCCCVLFDLLFAYAFESLLVLLSKVRLAMA